MPFAEDLALFTDPADFGVAASYTAAGEAAATVNGIFDREWSNELGMEGSGPLFRCAAADVPNVAHGDELVVGGVSYVVKGVNPDGTGMVDLILELAP